MLVHPKQNKTYGQNRLLNSTNYDKNILEDVIRIHSNHFRKENN